jgi:hypothetical protein
MVNRLEKKRMVWKNIDINLGWESVTPCIPNLQNLLAHTLLVWHYTTTIY